jgi:hypothetical protein
MRVFFGRLNESDGSTGYRNRDYSGCAPLRFAKKAIQRVSKKADNPYELFEFFLENYKATPKEQLLKLMEGSADTEALLQMDQVDLAIEYAERCVSAVLSGAPQTAH